MTHNRFPGVLLGDVNPMNALTLLKQDHGNVEELFHRFETAEPGDVAELARVRDLVVQHLSVHASIEEEGFYPVLRERLDPDAVATVLEGLEEHHIVKWTLRELEKMAPTDDRFVPKMTVLVESVRHHVEEEENDLFPKVRDAMTVEELDELGDTLDRLKDAAPTRPHPRVPDQPPLNILLGLPAAIVDRAMTLGKDAVGRVVRPLG